MVTQTAQTITVGQTKELGGALVEGIPTELSRYQAQALIGDKTRLHNLMELVFNLPKGFDIDELRKMMRSYTPFGDEELTDSNFLYKEGFPRLTWEQRLSIIQEHFGGLNTEGTQGIPKFIEILQQRGVDEWVDDRGNPYIIPDWRAVAETYAEATAIAWIKLARSKTYDGRAYNFSGEVVRPDYLRLVDEKLYRQLEVEWDWQPAGIPTATAHERLRELRPSPEMNVWPVFAQTGIRHRGRSLRRAYVCFSETEWGLGPFEIACILLTDGEDRLTEAKHLAIHAPGALYKVGLDFTGFLSFCFNEDSEALELVRPYFDYLRKWCGWASASLR